MIQSANRERVLRSGGTLLCSPPIHYSLFLIRRVEVLTEINPYESPRSDGELVSSFDAPDLEPRRYGVGFVLFIGVIVPGLPSMLMNRRGVGIALILVIPLAYVFFGPIWGLFLFRGTPYAEAGLIPFLISAVGAQITSVIHGLVTRSRQQRFASDIHLNQR